jgi:hypothetical protein
MTVDTLAAEAPSTDSDTPDVLVPSVQSTSPESTPAPAAPAAAASAEEKPKKAPAKKAAGKKTKTLELTVTVTGTADGEWHAELKQGTTYLARQLRWQRTGYMYFPYAAYEHGCWWVLRANYCFPEHDLCTLFINGEAVADVTASEGDPCPLISSIRSLKPITPNSDADSPVMDPELVHWVVAAVANYVEHGSEWGDPCDWCVFAERDPYATAKH